MALVRDIVSRFAESRGWSSQHRGFKAHASIYGPVRGVTGVIDIEMERRAWDAMPNALMPETPMTLWCSASADRGGVRLHADTELFWEVGFGGLLQRVPAFLEQAWAMLESFEEGNFGAWPGPSAR